MASEIRCPICLGTRIHPSHKTECGACLGTGRSTQPWDQPRHATTTGLRWEDFQRIGVQERTIGYRPDEIKVALAARQALNGLTEETKVLPDLQIHSTGRETQDHSGRQMLTGILISWANPDYAARLELDQTDKLYEGDPDVPQA